VKTQALQSEEMIYILQGCQHICSLPGLACKGCADLCGKMNCNWLRDCCSGCGNCVVKFHTKPLSSFVIVAFLFSGAVGYFAYGTAQLACKFKDDAMVDLTTFCYIMIGCAVLKIFFALYFQNRVWKQIETAIKEDYDKRGTTEATVEIQEETTATKMKKAGGGLLGAGLSAGRAQFGGGAEQQDNLEEAKGKERHHTIKKQTVQDGFKKTFMEDFGVLIYYLVSLGMVFLCYKAGVAGKEASGGDDCKKQIIYWLGYGFFTIPATYTFMWYCCGGCCAKAVPISETALTELTEGISCVE